MISECNSRNLFIYCKIPELFDRRDGTLSIGLFESPDNPLLCYVSWCERGLLRALARVVSRGKTRLERALARLHLRGKITSGTASA